MRLDVAYYKLSDGLWWSTQYTSIVSYTMSQRMDEPAECTIILTDPIGTHAQLFKNTATGTFIGPGRVSLQDPTGTYIFRGEFIKAVADTDSRTLTIYAQDHLAQLDREQIDYDMREKLGTTDYRESTLRSDSTNLTPAENVAGTYYVYDDGEYGTAGGMAFVADAYNTMYLVLTDGMAGKKKWKFYAYKGVDAGGPPTYADDWYQTWWDGGLVGNNYDRCFDGADYTLVYTFAAEIGHNTPSDFYVHDSISGAVIHLKYKLEYRGAGDHVHVEIYDNNAAAYVEVGHIDDSMETQEITITIGEDYLPYIVDATGEINLRFNCDWGGGIGSHDLYIYYCDIEIQVETTGYSTAVLINDTFNPNKLEIATDLTAAATQVWENVPYCIARKSYMHIASDETPGTLITDGDPIHPITCTATIEHTTAISTRQYIKKTRLEILQSEARLARAQFWIELGTTTLIWKSTFGADTVQLTDGDVNTWRMTTDSMTVANKFIVQGMRIGDRQLESMSSDATSMTAYQQTHTRVIKDAGLVSEADTKARADAGVAQYKDVMRMLTVRLDGNTAKTTHAKTLKLGDVVAMTSTFLGLTDVDYIVQQFDYVSGTDETTLLLHPKVTVIGLQEIQNRGVESLRGTNRRGTVDAYVPEPSDKEMA